MKLPAILKDILRAVIRVVMEKLLGAEKKEPPAGNADPGEKQ